MMSDWMNDAEKERYHRLRRAVDEPTLAEKAGYITALEADRDRLRALNAELLNALSYARRCMDPKEHDTIYVDCVIAKARLAPPTETGE